MLFKSIFTLSFLLGALVHAAPVAIPMPALNAVSQMRPREVELIRAYVRRQDDIVKIGDSIPVKGDNGVVTPLNKRQDDGIVQVSDSQPFSGDNGVLTPLAKRTYLSRLNKSEPRQSKRQDTDTGIVEIGDSAPAMAPDGVVVAYAQRPSTRRSVKGGPLRMKRSWSAGLDA